MWKRMSKDKEGVWRGQCRNHPEQRFGACLEYACQEGTNTCRTCGCVARAHVAYVKCTKHGYCSGYDEINNITGECANCGCTPPLHSEQAADGFTGRDKKPTPSGTQTSPRELAADKAVWDEVAKAAREKRGKYKKAIPPFTAGGTQRRARSIGHGGQRRGSGRKGIAVFKDFAVTPVRYKDENLGYYTPSGKKQFVTMDKNSMTLASLEDVCLREFYGITREKANTLGFTYHLARTLKGPQLSKDEHLLGCHSFYFFYGNTILDDLRKSYSDDDSDGPTVGSQRTLLDWSKDLDTSSHHRVTVIGPKSSKHKSTPSITILDKRDKDEFHTNLLKTYPEITIKT